MIDIIQNLPDYTKIGLASFSSDGYYNDKSWEDSTNSLVELGPLNSANRQSAIDFVLSLSSNDPRNWGGTMPWKSLYKAFQDNKTDTIYFLSDGKPNRDQQSGSWSKNDYSTVANYYSELNATRLNNGEKVILTEMGVNNIFPG